MAQRVTFSDMLADVTHPILGFFIVLVIFSFPLGFIFDSAESFVKNHHQWSQHASVAGYISQFYENNFLNFINDIYRDVKNSNSLGKAWYVVVTFVGAFVYVIAIPLIILVVAATSKDRKNKQKQRIKVIKALAVILTMWIIPLLFMGGLLYMKFYFS